MDTKGNCYTDEIKKGLTSYNDTAINNLQPDNLSC